MWHVNAEDKRIAEKLELSDRIDVTDKKEAFITLKDHKKNFRNKPTCKPELGKFSKQIVEKIVYNIRTKTNTNQWKNTNDVINWFNAIKDKSNYTMLCFDICDFYPSITNTLLQKALNYASKYADISEDQIHLLTDTKKTTLYKDGNYWEKTTSAFDVTMGSYDGAEICELVGLYLLSQLQNLNINVGLYRDNGLAVTNQKQREADRAKKKLCSIFKNNDLRIAVEANKKVTDFLDIKLDFHTGSYKPYKKPNDTICSILCQINQPPSNIKIYKKV